MKEHIVPICLWIIAVAAALSIMLYIYWKQESVATIFLEDDHKWKSANTKRATPMNYIDDHKGLWRASLRVVFNTVNRELVRDIASLQKKRNLCADPEDVEKRNENIEAKKRNLCHRIKYPMYNEKDVPCT